MVACNKCNKTITRRLVKESLNHYCNRTCAGTANKSKVAICCNCDEEFRYSGPHWGKFCSNKCKFISWGTEDRCNFQKMHKILEYLESKLKKEE